MVKKIICIGILVMALVFIISCGPYGGTVVIENDTQKVMKVAIGETPSVPDDTVDLQPGGKYEKSFDLDGSYYAFGYTPKFIGYGWVYKQVSFRGGDTVTVKCSVLDSLPHN